MPRDDLHQLACQTLRLALAAGRATPANLKAAMDHEHYPRREPQSWPTLGRVMKLTSFLPSAWLVEQGGDLIRHVGFGPEGVYFLEAYWPPYGAEHRVDVSFLPYGAEASSDIVTLLAYDIRDSRRGRDLLAALYRGPSPAQEARGLVPLGPLVNDVFRAMIGRGSDAMREHASGGYAGPASPLPPISPDVTAVLADRWYPQEALFETGRGYDEKWVAALPGRGHFVAFENPNPFIAFVTLDGCYEEKWPEHADDLMFRPSDEDIDPGLADRIRQADRHKEEIRRPQRPSEIAADALHAP